MKIGIACDHAGFVLAGPIEEHLKEKNIEVIRSGSLEGERVDYPDVAADLAGRLVKGEFDFGILICGTGIGISIAANKIKGIRCANVSEAYSAAMARRHNNANILALGGRTIGYELALSIVDAFLAAEFEGGRHAERVKKISKLEE